MSKSKSGFHFCNKRCKDAAQRKDSGVKFEKMRPDSWGTSPYKQKKTYACEACNQPFSTKKRFCSQSCHAAVQRQAKQEAWLASPQTISSPHGDVPTYIRYWLVEQHGSEACWECGEDRKNFYTNKSICQVDHINGDPTDNRPENLRRLCPNCHACTEFFGARGKGRPGRKVVPRV